MKLYDFWCSSLPRIVRPMPQTVSYVFADGTEMHDTDFDVEQLFGHDVRAFRIRGRSIRIIMAGNCPP